jgi:alkylated DNA repair dioxygenase AlkB
MSDTVKEFERNRFVVVRTLVAEPTLSSLNQYSVKRMSILPTEVEQMNDDKDAAPTPAAYGDPMMEILLANLTSRFDTLTGLELHPTFAYYRVYRREDRLEKHTDRKPCEIAVTLSIGQRGDQDWPLKLEVPSEKVRATLQPGDAVVYRGLECPHWRDAFEGEEAVQVFLFYVDRNGPYADLKYDKRDQLNSFVRPVCVVPQSEWHT